MRIFLPISILFINLIGFSQTEITWEDLKIDSFAEAWNEEYQAVHLSPIFNEKTKELDGKSIHITGFVVPIDTIGHYYVLSESKFNNTNCFMVYSDESINLQIKFDVSPKMYDIITVSGILEINKDEINQLNYILKDAKIITNK
ncbi:MAG: hypothetical protein ACI9N1_002330 [Flavobacteriales bacterium]|jgi:hypothetical protein